MKPMRKISYLIFLAVFIGVGTISVWLYVKYFKSAEQKALTSEVKQSDITESVKVRGKIAAKTEFDLGFDESGKIGKIFVSKGQAIKSGEPIIRLDLKEKESEARSLEAVLTGKKAGLGKLLAGYTKEDIAVSETKVKNAETSLSDARRKIADTLSNSYTVSDNAVRTDADVVINNPRSTSPSLSFTVSDSSLRSLVESERAAIEQTLNDWGILVNALNQEENLSDAIKTATDNLESVRNFLGDLALALNKSTANSSVSAADLSTWKSGVAAARVNVNAAIANLTSAAENWQSAGSDFDLARQELSLKLAGNRPEDIASAEADIAKAQSDLESMKEKIARSTIYAPADGIIKKIWLQNGEIAVTGETVVSLAASGKQIEADVSELDVVKINPGQPITVLFDAFPKQIFSGKVLSIDPEELDKDGDTYYRVNFSIDSPADGIRSGMSSDIKVDVITKTAVLTTSKLAVYKKDGKEYVKTLKNSKQEEVLVTTGISDGESVEILSGLNVGDEVVISAD